MEKEKRKRKAKWASCVWCERRRISPAFMSGKMKCLVKHMTECEAAYKIEQSCAERTKIDTVLQMMHHLKETVANLSSRVAVLEQRKARKRTDLDFWYKMTPKQAWKRRKENCVRVIRATLACFVPSRYCKTRLDYLEFMLVPGTGTGIADMLIMARSGIPRPWGILARNRHTGRVPSVQAGLGQTNRLYSKFEFLARSSQRSWVATRAIL